MAIMQRFTKYSNNRFTIFKFKSKFTISANNGCDSNVERAVSLQYLSTFLQ